MAQRVRAKGLSASASGDVAQDVWFDNWEKGRDLQEICRHFSRSDTTVSLLWFDEEELPEREFDRFGRATEEEDGLDELTGVLSWTKGGRR